MMAASLPFCEDAMTREIKVEVGGSSMPVFIAEPAGAGPHAAVVLIHHRDGVDEFTRATCERLAKNGFVAAAPNLFHRRPAGEDTRDSRKKLTDGEVVADINATVTALQAQKSVRGDKLGIMGHCMGGRMAYLGAASNPAFKAAVRALWRRHLPRRGRGPRRRRSRSPRTSSARSPDSSARTTPTRRPTTWRRSRPS